MKRRIVTAMMIVVAGVMLFGGVAGAAEVKKGIRHDPNYVKALAKRVEQRNMLDYYRGKATPQKTQKETAPPKRG